MKNINVMSTNKINIVGKLLDTTFGSDTLKDGRYYERATLTVRVNQTYGGREEISEIPVSLFATQYTKNNNLNPGFENIQTLKTLKTVQGYGDAEADYIRISNASLRENNYVSRNGQLINGWQINTSFFSSAKGMKDIASFNMDIFIMDMHDELDREGDPTGRMIIKGGVVQYNGSLDVIEFVVESPDNVEYLQRNWNINDTVNIGGRIRVTSKEENKSASSGSWGEDIPETSTRRVREFVITRGSDEPFEEDFAYDPVEIKKAFNVRKANIEQLQVNASAKATPKAAAATPTEKYSWE